MTRLSITGLIAFIFLMGASSVGAAPRDREGGGDQRTVILFGASWCAPCIAELRGIGGLAVAAPADRIVVAWADTGIARFRFEHPANVEVVSPKRAAELTQAYAADSAGYPYAVMLDGHGKVCARWRKGLTEEALATLRSQCKRHLS